MKIEKGTNSCNTRAESYFELDKMVLHIYRLPHTTSSFQSKLLNIATSVITSGDVISVDMEYCINIEVAGSNNTLPPIELQKLIWLITETFEPNLTTMQSFFSSSPTSSISSDHQSHSHSSIVEVGPRLAFSTAWSSNCLSMCSACGIQSVTRIERSRRYRIITSGDNPPAAAELQSFSALQHDRMTECVYDEPLSSFGSDSTEPEKIRIVPLLEKGKAALEEINRERGLGFDDWDLEYYSKMFIETMNRNPTDVECFDLGQSNSEHSRHWFFGGKMVIDGEEKAETLFQMVKSTLPAQSNSVIAFHDNSSAIHGFPVTTLTPASPTTASAMVPNSITLHPILTAETHNFPTGVAPFSGAETGTGGRLRDVQATGRGAHTVAGISAYCVGNLHIPERPMPWENQIDAYAANLATPLEIIVEASNGASDYGNKYGEPVVGGFCRSFGQRNLNGERFEFIKPIMFTAGVGWLDSRHAVKGDPEVGMVVVKIGGPVYRIGMGGGAASSKVQDKNSAQDAALDFNAVQRGDAEMENRMNRVIRACVELGDENPIISIHDQGAGGNGNVLKEIVDPQGATYELRSLPTGDPTLSVLEIWGAEYQENNAILVRESSLEIVLALSRRENCPVTPCGVITGDGRVTVRDSKAPKDSVAAIPFDMPLSLVLGKMPQKSFSFQTPSKQLGPLVLPTNLSVLDALDKVLMLVDVGSKRFLTNKVDRSVTGLVAQQQCVGPLHTPLSNVAVIAQSHFATTGVAVSVGEQPIKGLLSSAAQARMTVGEALTNMVWANITSLSDIKASGNWMWAAKMEGEGAKMYEACSALRDALIVLGPAIDGGKDSLSMAARVGGCPGREEGEIVKSPGQVTLTCYAPCLDITKTVTPDFKNNGNSEILLIDLGKGNFRLGGSSLSTVFGQLGDECADVEDLQLLKRTFECVQKMVSLRLIESGHDRSDGGLLICLLEMAFAGNIGFDISLPIIPNVTSIEQLFSEELGLVLEIKPENVDKILCMCAEEDVPCERIGSTNDKKLVTVTADINSSLQNVISAAPLAMLRDKWEATSFALERRQCSLECVEQEQQGLSLRKGAPYKTTFSIPTLSVPKLLNPSTSSKVCVIRQEGSNGDREMLAALSAAGLESWDVNMQDLLSGSITLDRFRGLVFCGGFSYADVNDSAKGWAGVIKFNEILTKQFTHFRRERKDTFSLGVCNGCQLMALLGWVPFSSEDGSDSGVSMEEQPRFTHNSSGRFESRWSALKVMPTNAVLLSGMVGSVLGVWVSHGEGRVHFPNPSHLSKTLSSNLAPLRYVDDDGEITEKYPFNPNGSSSGIAALCSEDGRHLAMMPHPERCFVSWQMPHTSQEWRSSSSSAGSNADTDADADGCGQGAPWLKMFTNAKAFCDQHDSC